MKTYVHFFLDPSSLNLQKRINICDQILNRILIISVDYLCKNQNFSKEQNMIELETPYKLLHDIHALIDLFDQNVIQWKKKII